ncbi:hypothetical protein CVT26_009225 [Gymnopilus dilepis]|uniref:ATP-dependent DNA helicase n=1 Tax=Gymnopilus dilepis TaxID=231916 RepID=A0A409WCF8_9AGAR|nr:hypothetical protein CVT26_009225 [Gymnopilus dilepis]
MVAPLDTVKMNDVLPPGPEFIKDTMCIVFVGDRMPTRTTISKFGPVLVRKSRVKTMIQFLLQNNIHYKEGGGISFSQENLDALFPSDKSTDIPSSVHIGHLSADQSSEVLESGYAPRHEEEDISAEEGDEVLMENVSFTDGDDSTLAYRTMKMLALERCLNGKPFLVSGTGNRLVPDFNNPSIMTWLFPHLDPWGIAGFYHPGRRIKISMEEQLSHMLRTDDPLLENDPEFASVFFNVVRKYLIAQCVRFNIPRRVYTNVVREMLSIDPDTLAELCRRFEDNPLYVPQTDEHRNVMRTLRSVSMLARNVPGSDGYKVNLRNEIRALIYSIGTPTLFVTLNPSDVDNPIVRVFAGEHLNLDDMTRGEDMTSWRRKLFAAYHPAACARFFDFMVQTFINVILRYGRNEAGLFGRCTGYYGVVEAQGRGSLHCHMLIWLAGHLPPQELRIKLLSSPDYASYLYRWLDSIIMNSFPKTLTSDDDVPDRSKRVRAKDVGDPHPGTIPSPSFLTEVDQEGSSQKWREFTEHLTSLLYEYNWHEHTATCWKYLRKGQSMSDKNCRMRMDGTLEPCTRYDEGLDSVVIRRLHPKISSYNDVMTFLMKCNVNIQFVGPGEAAKAYIYYVTDYITKPSLPMHVGFSALIYAIKKVRDSTASRNNGQGGEVSPRAAITVANSMMGKQEISHPQVMSYLVGGGDHYSPFRFQKLHRWSFVAYVATFFSSIVGTDEQLDGNSQRLLDDHVELSFSNGNVTENSQVLDYCMRPEASPFQDMCLYEFVSECMKRGLDKSGTRENSALFFSRDHPQRSTHCVVMRREKIIPILLGSAIPDPAKSDTAHETWARDVLILFKPWRSPLDLKTREMTWVEAYEEYKGRMSDSKNSVIKNICTLAQCADARDGLSRSRNRAVAEEGDNRELPEEDIEDLQNIDIVDTEIWKERHGADIFRTLPGLDEGVLQEGEEPSFSTIMLYRTLGGDVARVVETCFPYQTRTQGTDHPDLILYDTSHHAQVTVHCEIMSKKRKRTIRDEDGQSSEDDSQPPRRRVRRHSSPFVDVITTDALPDHQVFLGSQELVEDVIRNRGLASNADQLRAFRIVADHVVERRSSQLLMYISGVGGTGKSHVIKSIVTLFERLGRRQELLLGAPTGIAAILIGGQTIHSLILTSPTQKSTNLAMLTDIWRGVHYLIIDEVSMIGAQFLSQMSNRIRRAKGDEPMSCLMPFGGVNVIFVGDLGQLKPPMQHALYSHELVLHPSFTQTRDTNGINSVNGALLWRQINVVVELSKNVRHSRDPTYASFLSRLRVGNCISRNAGDSGVDDYEYLQSRLLSEIARRSQDELSTFSDAPVIVGSKALRDLLNARLIAYHASRLDTEVKIYYSKDTSRSCQIPEVAREFLWSIPSSENNDSFGRLPLFVGMKVMITENIAFNNKIVNGTEGEIRSIYFEDGADGRSYAVVAYVYVPGSGFDLPGLGPDVVPVFPTRVHIKRKDLSGLGIQARSFTRSQLPLVPAYAYTDFKSQGRTLDRVIVDLVTARGQGVYVMLSRVTSISGLAILRWFPPTKVFHRIPQELRSELDRLRNLV